MKIADGTIVTPLLVRSDEQVISGKDQFQRITPATYAGTMFTWSTLPQWTRISKWSIATSATKLNSITLTVLGKQWQWLHTIEGISIMGYASPDGTEKINADLSVNRAKASAKYPNDEAVWTKTQNENHRQFIFAQATQMKTGVDSNNWCSPSDMAKKTDLTYRFI